MRNLFFAGLLLLNQSSLFSQHTTGPINQLNHGSYNHLIIRNADSPDETAKESGVVEVAVTEINYNSDELTKPKAWVELHNYGNSSVDISSWKLKDETAFNSYTIPDGTILSPDEYLVIVQDIDTFEMIFPAVTNIVGPFLFGFDNTSGIVKIEDNSGTLIKSISYYDSVPWPKGSDGLGPTLQIIDESGDENNPANWFAGCVLGTPGAPYEPCNYSPVVDEINYNSLLAYNPGDWIEIWNNGTSTLDLSGWIIKDRSNNNIFIIPDGTSIPADNRLVISDSLAAFTAKFPTVTNVIGEPDFHFSNGGEAVRLYDASGKIKYSVRYYDSAPWPTDPDGVGFTLESSNTADNPNIATNWVAGCLFGSPGKEFTLPCGDAIETITTTPFTISPNPFSDQISIQFNQAINYQSIYITDITGKRIADLNKNQNQLFWNGTDNSYNKVPAGIYYLNMTDTSGKIYSAQIVRI